MSIEAAVYATQRLVRRLGGAFLEAERRQVTVLFTDMIGFTTFSERSGEEAAFTLTQSLSKLMGEAVRDPRFALLAPDGSQ